jgi:hypothetical protein
MIEAATVLEAIPTRGPEHRSDLADQPLGARALQALPVLVVTEWPFDNEAAAVGVVLRPAKGRLSIGR